MPDTQKHSPRAPGWVFAEKVGMAKLTGQFAEELRTSSKEDFERRLEEYEKSLPRK